MMGRVKLESAYTGHPMAEPFQTTFILFVDMLGFAALVEKEGDELNELSPIFTGVELYSPSKAGSLLGFRFINFHRCLNQARVRLQEMGAGTAIVFSDTLPRRRIEVRFGKFTLPDFLHTNSVGTDTLQFINWTVDNNGAWDYAADTRGYTIGGLIEYDDTIVRYRKSKRPPTTRALEEEITRFQEARGKHHPQHGRGARLTRD
jgi:hypothetical protein